MTKTTKTIIWIIVVVLVIAGAYLISQQDNTSLDGSIKIGAPLILSGEAASWGQNAQRGINMAVDEFIENNPEASIDVIFEDTQLEASKALSSFQKLININNVDAVIGPLSQPEVSAISPIANQEGVPVVTPSYAPIENRPNPRNPLMIWMDPTTEAQQMAEYVYNQEGVQTISVLGTQDSWEKEVSNAFTDKFEELGGEVVTKEIVQTDISDIRSTVTKLLENNPEGVYLGTYYQFIESLRAIKERGYEGNLYSIEVDSYLADQTKEYSDGLKFISPESYKEGFINRFESKFDQKPGIPAGQAYDATNILLSFFQDTTDKSEIIDKMENIREYNGASGNITITNDNRTIFPTAIYTLNNGESEKIEDL